MFPTVLLALSLDARSGHVHNSGDRDRSAVEGLLSLAVRLGVQRLVVLHALDREPLPPALRRAMPPASARLPPELRTWGDALRAALPDVQVDLVLADGSLAEAIAEQVEQAGPDLLVTGRRAGPAGTDRLGINGRRLLRQVQCCHLVVPEGWAPPAQGAILGMDFSSQAFEAVPIAQALFDELTCVFQYDPDHRPAGTITEVEFAQQMAENAQLQFEAGLPASAGPRGPVLEVVAAERPAEALVARAGRSRVLVVGSRGLSPLASMVLGSTAERLAGLTEGPLLILRQKGHEVGLVEGLIRR